jgi:hypothetical protein
VINAIVVRGPAGAGLVVFELVPPPEHAATIVATIRQQIG